MPLDALPAPRLTQPEAMKTERYRYGVEEVNGFDAWRLFEASYTGDVSVIRSLLAGDPRLVNAQYWYEFPIHMAVRGGQTEVVRLLLAAGADPGQSRFTYSSWQRLLAMARERGLADIERALVEAMRRRFGYDPEFELLRTAIVSRDVRDADAVLAARPKLATTSDELGNNALHWCVLTRQRGLLERFVRLGTPLEGRRADGQTPLLLATNGATDYWNRGWRPRDHPTLRNPWLLVGALLQLGAEYVLSVAAAVGDLERVEQLLSEDPGLAGRLDSARVSPLTQAAGEGHAHIVRVLLDRGADPNAPEDGCPNGGALFAACCGNRVDIAGLLLERGADPNAGADSSGCCLTIGRVNHGSGARPLEELLRKHGAVTPPYALGAADLKRALRDRMTAVVDHEEFSDQILRHRDPELLSLFLAHVPDAANQLGFDDIARSPHPDRLIRHLLECGLDPRRTDWLGRTLLHACAAAGRARAVEVLLDAGGDIDAREAEHGDTPLGSARRSSHSADASNHADLTRVVQLLRKRGAR